MTAAMLAVGLLLGGCGGGGGSDGAAATTSAAAPDQAATAAAKLAKEADAARLAKQATFGPTPAVLERITALGFDGWLDEQFAASGSSYVDLTASPAVTNSCTDNVCFRRNFTREQVAMRFYANALSQPDQLRQRVAFALSQLLVASTAEVLNGAGLAAYQQILLGQAFGNYRDVLMAVTMSGFMGDYLDMADSNRSAPSENYAREMLQLFSMGVDRLNMDGTPVRDATGATVPNYTPDDIRGIARALTGWTYARLDGAPISDSNRRDYTRPMIAVPARYDTAAKSFLGTTVPAGASQTDSVAAVVDAAFNNPSTPPYVARFLIQHLVTANPTPAYVARIAAVFANNGGNVRGDLRAVVRAILTDGEARGPVPADDRAGKVKEPVLLLTSLARLIGMTSDGVVLSQRDVALGQAVFQAPSVFNFYPPDYPLAQTALVSPASKLLTSGSSVQRANLVYDWTIGALTLRTEFATAAGVYGAGGTTLDWSGWEAFGADTAGMIDRIDLLLLARTITPAQRAALKGAADAITDANPALQARRRAQAMLYAVAASPLFQVDR